MIIGMEEKEPEQQEEKKTLKKKSKSEDKIQLTQTVEKTKTLQWVS